MQKPFSSRDVIGWRQRRIAVTSVSRARQFLQLSDYWGQCTVAICGEYVYDATCSDGLLFTRCPKVFYLHCSACNNVINIIRIGAKDVLPNISCTQAAERAQNAVFVPDLDLQTYRLRHQTRLPCESDSNPFSGSGDISNTNKKPQTDGAKNRTFRSSLRAVKTFKQ